ncbi:uncharacterized protein LOC122046516 isoform X2 [Zingiber officinale]|uniref:uncharacterized protein LOC122046516 isoform X2 n=1 Tax=Zingiber officinale TaxID=94328 RepID=UPI001C4C202C|nr:uncharacterized protein LOC122046516 isoform X2 [Zingiber officinale]
MSSGMQTMRGLVDEAKNRVVLLLICVFGLSYLMSLTSSSVWVNLPAAAVVIIFSLYLSHELDIRRKPTPNKISIVSKSPQSIPVELLKFPIGKSDWRKKVNSPIVEVAIEQFTRHLVSEWVIDLWYSRITPDRDGPEELVEIITRVIGEISCRARDVNLIDLLTRDVVNLLRDHLELYRYSQSKIGRQENKNMPFDQRDIQIKLVLAAGNKLHPALFSAEAEHKVLQNLVRGIMFVLFKPEDLNCLYFRHTVRELLACTVIRPVLNLVNPRFINERIESLVLSRANNINKKFAPSAEEAPIIMRRAHSVPSDDQTSCSLDHSSPGLELVQLKNDNQKTGPHESGIINGMHYTGKENESGSKFGLIVTPRNHNDLPVSLDFVLDKAKDSWSKDTLLLNSQGMDEKKPGAYASEWAQMLDILSRRKTQALAPEHLDDLWAKGRNYKKKEASKLGKSVAQSSSITHSEPIESKIYIRDISKKFPTSSQLENLPETDCNDSNHSDPSFEERIENTNHEETKSESLSSYTTDDESSSVTGLGSPGTKVWESKNKKDSVSSSIRHPLEATETHGAKRSGKVHIHHRRTSRTLSVRKRSRSSNQKAPLWQEVARTSFLLADGHDILKDSKNDTRTLELTDNSDTEARGRINNGATALSSVSTESSHSSMKSHDILVLADTFLKLRCEVLGANIVKSGSGTFAVYSISVTDANNNSWFIKRRYRHFEELHRHLKEFPEYNLHLPPKHFLSSGLDLPVVQERCKLLDIYLKLLQIPSISESIDVWDFLSIDSQTYIFTDSLSVIQTLSVNLDDKPHEKSAKRFESIENIGSQFSSAEKNFDSEIKDSSKVMTGSYSESDGLRMRKSHMEQIPGLNSRDQNNPYHDNSENDYESRLRNNTSYSGNSNQVKNVSIAEVENLQESSKVVDTGGALNIPTECVPPNLSVPILNLVDVIFQLKDGGWIRRQAFWIAKQLLQLGMGDAFDDWLIEKIQLLRTGVVIASAIKRVEQVLWPDGIFITKHPKRKATAPISTPGTQSNLKSNPLTYEQQVEADRRAKFVYELIYLFSTEKAPPALVGLVGRKEYEQCAQDIFFFLQSPFCLKHFAFELLELLLLSTFPELSEVVRECHEEKVSI